jgi:VanZ family protein
MTLIAGKPIRTWIRIAAVLCIVAIAILSLTPRENMIRTSLGGHAEHVLAYSICAWFCIVTCDLRRQQIAIFGALVAYAGILECLQLWVPGRHFGLDDFAASAIGVTLGTVAALLTIRWKT